VTLGRTRHSASTPVQQGEPAVLKVDPAATQVLDRAIQALDPKEIPWLETTLWQRAQGEGWSYQSEGRFLAAPGNRLRLDLKVQVGKTPGRSSQVCDGRYLWQRLQVGQE